MTGSSRRRPLQLASAALTHRAPCPVPHRQPTAHQQKVADLLDALHQRLVFLVERAGQPLAQRQLRQSADDLRQVSLQVEAAAGVQARGAGTVAHHSGAIVHAGLHQHFLQPRAVPRVDGEHHAVEDRQSFLDLVVQRLQTEAYSAQGAGGCHAVSSQ